MEQYDKLFPSAYVHSSPPLLVPSGAAQGGEAESAAQEAAGREVWHCGGDGGSELDGGGDPKKRRLSDEQVEMLELSFREERKLETGRKVHLAAELGLDPKQVAVWFQNRRVRHKSKLLEEEFAKLKQAHDAAILQQCHLENEVIRLKKKLEVTEDELARLRSAAGSHAVSGDGGDAMGRVVCSGSPSSSFSTGGTCQQPGVGGGDHLGDDELLYVPDNAYADNSVVEWFSLCGLM